MPSPSSQDTNPTPDQQGETTKPSRQLRKCAWPIRHPLKLRSKRPPRGNACNPAASNSRGTTMWIHQRRGAGQDPAQHVAKFDGALGRGRPHRLERALRAAPSLTDIIASVTDVFDELSGSALRGQSLSWQISGGGEEKTKGGSPFLDRRPKVAANLAPPSYCSTSATVNRLATRTQNPKSVPRCFGPNSRDFTEPGVRGPTNLSVGITILCGVSLRHLRDTAGPAAIPW